VEDELYSELWHTLIESTDLNRVAKQVLTGSKFVKEWGERYPERASALIASGDLTRTYDSDAFNAQLAAYLNSVTDEPALHRQLRLFRQREMVRIIWRDLAGWSDLAETVRELSALAAACVEQSLSLLQSWLEATFGQPLSEQGDVQELIVLAMGKLGAGELNLSSDIDLIFCYPHGGDTQGGRRSLSNEMFFTRLGQKLIQALDNVTADGFVFRVDMRLRPFGDSGALALSFDAMEDYYQTQGREWERYAMIKARPITGTEQDKERVMALLGPFIYRRYLDYGVFTALREMKAMIAGQLHKKGLEDNIKLGSGGIREIEFIGQAFQLINGGREQRLTQRPILAILDVLAEIELLEFDVVTGLKSAYNFLRRTEHRIQAWADQQTHILPKDEAGQVRIAQLMGFATWAGFSLELNRHRQLVKTQFKSLLTLPVSDEEQSCTVSFISLPDDKKQAVFTALNFSDSEQCVSEINALLKTHNCQNLNATGLDRLTKLLPLIIEACGKVLNPDICLSRIMSLLTSIMRRSSYMSLLFENPDALTQLVKLCSASSWISEYLTQYPVLLDELLDPAHLYNVSSRQKQERTLALAIKSVDAFDLEQQMRTLREFKQTTLLHVAAADVTDVIPLSEVGNQLSSLAEIELKHVMILAWSYLVAKHGKPPQTDEADLSQSGFSMLAYGKLGGLELGYGSDLDLVFIYDDGKPGQTDGVKPIEALMFYTRLAQRMVHILNTRIFNGLLYETDMRLRPNGESGFLVTSLSGFADYQKNDAWTWEHQALVRARPVVGDEDLASKIADIRRTVLIKPRNQNALAIDVSDMRAKMRNNLDKSTQQLFDLKQGVGGITDIEFMVQYAVLAWSASIPELVRYTDNLRVLEQLSATAKLSSDDATLLATAYRFYRTLANHCVLEGLPTSVPIEKVAQYQPHVAKIWQKWLN
jgi:glutamate-ammonia-ligase adenylyltransferase